LADTKGARGALWSADCLAVHQPFAGVAKAGRKFLSSLISLEGQAMKVIALISAAIGLIGGWFFENRRQSRK
jgi:hypothetical protein